MSVVGRKLPVYSGFRSFNPDSYAADRWFRGVWIA
jgi:hypothetical protein